ncbi:ABC transporter substrate-binding protein [Paenibacillus mesophilus]|uniref:ABC transporter substrate-binding protein n=1 Tax=Paenibacillus mesophilus TaxID=2582849 RepID=UPI0013053F23|nr:extracellular solute-binding protein [Paenibacillus mesophilus]
MTKKRKPIITGAVIGTAVMMALTGCLGKSSEPVTKVQPEPVKKTLKVAYFDQQRFMNDYGNALKKLLPDIEFQVIPTMQIVNRFAIAIDTDKVMEQKPDLINGSNLIKELSKSGKVMELSAFIKQDAFDLNVFIESSVEQLRALGNGKLTSLSPAFNSTATFYNKEKFDRWGVSYPTNNMSWQSMMELAKKLARNENGKQHYGIYTNFTHFTMASIYATGIGAPFLSGDRRTVNYMTGASGSAANIVLDAYRTGAIYLAPEKMEASTSKTDSMLRNKFVSGEAAIALYSPSLIATMAESNGLGIPPIKWDIVTEPINPAQPDQSIFGIYVSDPFGITSDSPNKAVAWEVIKAITGTTMATEIAKTKTQSLSTRKDSMMTVEGRKLDAFYAHKTVFAVTGDNVWSTQLAQKVNLINSEEMADILYGRKSDSDGLAAMQKRVQQAIDEEYAVKK